jgi:DNA-binding protein HU-beta
MVEAVAKQLDTSKAQAGDIVNALFGSGGIIAKELKKGGSVQLTGFGSFLTRKRAARTGRNPQTGKAIKIKASIVPAIRAAKALKDAVKRVAKRATPLGGPSACYPLRARGGEDPPGRLRGVSTRATILRLRTTRPVMACAIRSASSAGTSTRE